MLELECLIAKNDQRFTWFNLEVGDEIMDINVDSSKMGCSFTKDDPKKIPSIAKILVA
jgi:hypothetical protein